MTIYRIQEIPGKGLGLVATENIVKATRILSEIPILKVPLSGYEKEFYEEVTKSVAELAEPFRQIFYSLSNAWEAEDGPVAGRVWTNTLPLAPIATDIPIGGVFNHVSRINHSCYPNTQYSWNEALQKLSVYSTQDIGKGEEITINYLGSRGQDQKTRKAKIRAKFNFICSCNLCSLSGYELKVSDERYEEMGRLTEELGSGAELFSAPLEMLHKIQRLLKLLNDDGLEGIPVSRAYYDAFQIAVTHGDDARASVFAGRSALGRGAIEGDDSLEVRRIEELVSNPSQFLEDDVSIRWKTYRSEVPEGLSKDEFERWLWRKDEDSVRQYADFWDETTFPSFDALPEKGYKDLEFFESTDGVSYKPRKHWCFLGEIVVVENLTYLKVTLKDKTDLIIPLFFYTEGRGGEIDPPVPFRKGYTLALFYAQRHTFPDGVEGIRHENPAALKIIPAPLERLLPLSDKMQIYATETKGLRTCQGCDQKADDLKKCSKCGTFWYCDTECQAHAWEENGHKKDCKLLRDPDIRNMFLLDWSKFEDYVRFPLTLPEED